MTGGDVDEGRHDDWDERWERLEEAAIEAELDTGRREPDIQTAKRHILIRIAIVVAGSLVTLLGLLLLVLPGPGLLVVLAGLLLLSTEVPFAARLVERVRERLPQDADGKLPTSAIVSMVVVAVLALGGSIWFTLLR